MCTNIGDFLLRIDPGQSYDFHSLSGGLVNVTNRAIKRPPFGQGTFPRHNALILKYAPPFVAALGEGVPFSQDRQTIEAQALTLLTTPCVGLSRIGKAHSVSIPKVVCHSLENHILVLSDLGPLPTLSEVLSSLSRQASEGFAQRTGELYDIGYRLGGFFAELHSPEALRQVQEAIRGDLVNALARDVILQGAVLPIKDYLLRFEVGNAEDLFDVVLSDFQRVDTLDEHCFALGDFIPGAVLIDTAEDTGGALGVIDWEFSGLGRGVNGDMAQFLAHLHLQLIAATPGSTLHNRREWLEDPEPPQEAAQPAVQLTLRPLARLKDIALLRSAMILHGREMINNAIERDWECSCCKKTKLQKEHCCLVTKMVRKGVWYVETAGTDIREFSEEGNWLKVLKEEDQ